MGVLLWGFLIAVAAAFVVMQILGKRKYKDHDMSVDPEWLSKSKAKYAEDNTVKQYYMHIDKNYTHQGHVVEDRSHNVVFEEKVLYATANEPFEVDFVNHINSFTSHHQIGHPVSWNIGTEERGYIGISSYFKFDGVNVWKYIKNNGYGFRPGLKNLGYTVEVTKGNTVIGKIYSSGSGKTFFNGDTDIKATLGVPGNYVLECPDNEFDMVFLIALAFARTETGFEKFCG